MTDRPIRVVLAKLGLDGHDRGIRVVARVLRDAGMEVIYTGLWQTARHVARAVADEDADTVGISLLSGAHLTLVPDLIDALRAEGVGHVPVVIGGIVPDGDVPVLEKMGVARVLGPGTTLERIVGSFRELAAASRAGQRR
ncbi:MAG: cobalamin B12-binding domain-containing protein [Planctomycetes bacterium]|nr:cobalamin B12-binding domain-containing protein [Planctomycetota bacterium]